MQCASMKNLYCRLFADQVGPCVEFASWTEQPTWGASSRTFQRDAKITLPVKDKSHKTPENAPAAGDLKPTCDDLAFLLGGVKRTLEVYRRVDDTTKNYPWAALTTEERWHSHAEGALMVALSSLNLPAEAWKSARILRAIPNCRLVLMMSYHFLSPALSVEENGLMAYLQTPPEAGPSVTQVTKGLQNWKCAGRRLVEIGGRLPTAT